MDVKGPGEAFSPPKNTLEFFFSGGGGPFGIHNATQGCQCTILRKKLVLRVPIGNKYMAKKVISFEVQNFNY
jgi:hypothetical protein